jgi:acyl-CoA synthetase (NDP forming)
MRPLFDPRRIALIGASTDASRRTARAQVYLRRHGVTGDLFPVSPRASEVLGEPAYAYLAEVPGPIDLAYILVGTEHVEQAVTDCAPRPAPPLGDLTAAAVLLTAPDEPACDEVGASALFAELGLENRAIQFDPTAPPKLAYPVALKAVSATIAHKTEAGAVALNIPDEPALVAACAAMTARLGPAITGFIAQPMVNGQAEVILGYRLDPLVGPIVALGAGGVLAEIYRDVTLRLAPVNEAEAVAMITEIRGLVPARGYRNMPKGDLATAARAVAALCCPAPMSNTQISSLGAIPGGQGPVMAETLVAVLQS